MQEIYIRNYGNGNIRYFMSKEEYDEKFNEEIKGLEEELIKQGDSDQTSITGYDKPLALDMGRVSRFYFT